MEEKRIIGRRRNLAEFGDFVSLFSGYENSKPVGKISLSDFLLQPMYKEQVEEIRNCPDKAGRRQLKSKLPAVTPSGIFSKRCNTGLIQHSGLICIDIDGQDNPNIDDWETIKLSVSDLPGLWYAGLSASGRGVFLIFRVKYPEKHFEHFNAIARELHHRGIKTDQACKDVARLRGASYEPNPFYNPMVAPYEGLLQKEIERNHETPIYNQSTADLTASRVNRLVNTIEATGANIAEYYPDWYAIGRSLASEFGESGRSWFHVVSSKSTKYEGAECDKQYSRCLQTCSRTSIRTFFYYCKQNGITANDTSSLII